MIASSHCDSRKIQKGRTNLRVIFRSPALYGITKKKQKISAVNKKIFTNSSEAV